ncbi:protein PML-like [Mytilus edulis]|uniref:protein PML-like n=1 Tax=Mytilus edulis TaxID=6550 RepID=UPI0039F14B68
MNGATSTWTVRTPSKKVTVQDIHDMQYRALQGRDSHIIQLSAVNSQNTKFNRYIKPARPILPQASEATGLKFQNGKMYHDDREVQSIGISNALTAFILFLKEIHNTVLVGHNSKIFDVPILINALEKNGLLNNFMSSVKGFIDTLPLFKECIPNQPSYSQPKMYNTLFGELYSAHDSMEDVVALRRLFEKISPSLVLKSKFSGTYESVMQLYQHRNCTKGLLTTLRPLTKSKTITNCMATKIASSGLGLSHLKLANKRDRQQGIENLFTELCGHPSKARVTKSKKNNTGNINLSE